MVATMISRMIGTPVFSDRTEFSVCTGQREQRDEATTENELSTISQSSQVIT